MIGENDYDFRKMNPERVAVGQGPSLAKYFMLMPNKPAALSLAIQHVVIKVVLRSFVVRAAVTVKWMVCLLPL